MRNTWLVARREFVQRVRVRGFWISSIALPVLLLAIWAISGGMGGQGTAEDAAATVEQLTMAAPVGYVDEADLITLAPDPLTAPLLTAYADRDAAEAALARGEIAAYYVIPAEYRETGAMQRVAERLPGLELADDGMVDSLLLANLVAELPADVAARLRQPLGAGSLSYVDVTTEQQGNTGDYAATPMMIVALVMIPLYSSGGLLLRSLAQEKTNRTMEILLVSLRPRQLLSGKLLGLGALTIVQYLVWAVLGLALISITGQDLSALAMETNLGAGQLALVVVYAMGGFLLYSGLMAGLGALAPNLESSRAWVFIVSLPMLIPLYLWTSIAAAPNDTLAVALSLFPLSAPVGMMMRLGNAVIPLWQVELSVLLLYLCGLGTVRLMGRLFRVQTLLSGEPLSARRMWAVLRSPEG